MKETNNNQKPKTSKLAIASVVCICTFLFLITALVTLFPFLVLGSLIGIRLLEAAGLSITWLEHFIEWLPEIESLNLVLLGTFIAAPVFGIVSLIHIRLSKRRLSGKALAFVGIAIPAAIGLFGLGWMLIGPDVQFRVWQPICASSLKRVGASLQSYASDYGDQLPTDAEWCDLLITQTDIYAGDFVCSEICNTYHGESCYALNKNITKMKLSEIPPDVVLLFETNLGRVDSPREELNRNRNYFWKIHDPNDKRYYISYGEGHVYKDRWNQVGGKVILTTEHHQGKGCNILFADGSVRFVKKEDLDTLRWEP